MSRRALNLCVAVAIAVAVVELLKTLLLTVTRPMMIRRPVGTWVALWRMQSG